MPDDAPKLLDHGVSDGMSVGVVNPLEIVDVKQKKRQLRYVAPAEIGDQAFDAVIHEQSGIKTRQRVSNGAFVESLRLLAEQIGFFNLALGRQAFSIVFPR